ncbi:nucleotidyltransferase family protein [Candidatus Uhrbacteria bacterium]|nr:nucleotidyltransferase family protein [Candidatus Uhrbacteria bacterium]
MKPLTDYLDTIRVHYDELRDVYHVQRIGIFGSTARGEQTSSSDMDVLVSFTEPPSMFRFLDLEERLSDLLKRRVDLVTERALKPAMRERVLRDTVYAEAEH